MGVSLPPVEDEEEFQAWKRQKPPVPSKPIEDPWLRAPLVAPADVTGNIRKPKLPAPPPAIKAIRRPIGPKPNPYPMGKRSLETEPRLGDQSIKEMSQDFLMSEGLFAANKPLGVIADFTAGWPARAGAATRKALHEGSPVAAGAITAASTIPVVGGKAREVVKRIVGKVAPTKRVIKDAPFEAYSRLEHAVDKAPFERGSSEQWQAALKQNVAGGERSFRGVDQLLEGKKGQPVERAEIQKHLEANPLKVKRSQYGGKPREAELEADRVTPDDAYAAGYTIRAAPGDNGPYIVLRPDGVNVNYGSTREEAERWMVAHAQMQGVGAGRVRISANTGLPQGWEIREVPTRPAALPETTGDDPREAVQQFLADAAEPPAQPIQRATMFQVIDPNGHTLSQRGAFDDARREAIRLAGIRAPATNPQPKFGQYKQPGGENYTETVLHFERNAPNELPPGYKLEKMEDPNDGFEHEGINITNPNLDEVARELPEGVTPDQYYKDNVEYWAWKNRQRQYQYYVVDPAGRPVPNGEGGSEIAAKRAALKTLKPRAFTQPGHFPGENPLGHHRFTDHERNGERVRFVEEMQSDWGQKARKKANAEKAIPKLTAELNAFGAVTPETELRYNQLRKDLDKARWTQTELKDLPGNQPFQKTEEWTELLLKDIIDQAKEDGIDRVAFATGAQNAAHYSLAKHVDRITYDRQTGKLIATKGTTQLHEGTYDHRALDDVIGKEAAERLLASEPSLPTSWDPARPRGAGAPSVHVLEGEGLKVGGHGMEGYYDEMVPLVVKEYAKKMGVKLDLEPIQMFGDKAAAKRYREAGEFEAGGTPGIRYQPDEGWGDSLHLLDDDTGELRTDLFDQGADILDNYSAEDFELPPPGSNQLAHDALKAHMRELQTRVNAGENFHAVLDAEATPVRDQIMSVLGLKRMRQLGEGTHYVEGRIPPGPILRHKIQARLGITHTHDIGNDLEDLDPVELQLSDILHRMEEGETPEQALNGSLTQLSDDVDFHAAEIVADELGLTWKQIPKPELQPSFSMKALRDAGPQPYWAVGAGGAAAATAMQGGDPVAKGGLTSLITGEQPDDPKPPVPDEAEFREWKKKNLPVPDEAEFEAWEAAQQGSRGIRAGIEDVGHAIRHPIETVKGMGKAIARDWRNARAPVEGRHRPPQYDPSGIPIRDIPRESEIVGEEEGVTLREKMLGAGNTAINAGFAIAPALALPLRVGVNAGLGALHSPDDRLRGATSGAVLGEALHGAVKGPKAIAGAVRRATDVSEGMVEAGAQGLKTPPPPPPGPPTPEQIALRARLTEDSKALGLNLKPDPNRPLRRRPGPPQPPPPVEPGPGAETYSTKGARRRAAEAPKAETRPLERRQDPEAPRRVWTPEERSRYVTDVQKAYAAKMNKPWSQWTPEEREGYFTEQAAARANAPWQREPTPTVDDAVSWPPAPKEGDLRPVAAAGREDLEVRPGIMRDVNKGEQPAALGSPLRLPEPTDADRAVVQPKGYKEVSPEEVAARKATEPIVTATPKPLREQMPEGAKLDEQGLFFEHRTPGGELRDFRRVSVDGLIKAHREMQEQIVRDQQLAIYRNVEADVSGTQYGVNINAATKTSRGTSQQAEAAERLRNYEKVMGRIDAELKKRGLTPDDVYARITEQEELEAALEREAIDYADRADAADTAFDFDDVDAEPPRTRGGTSREPPEEPISDVLNVAKLNLGSKTAEQRMAAKLEEFRSLREQNKQTWDEADVNRVQILDELRASDPLALSAEKAKKLSGEELLARRDLVKENDEIITSLSKRLEEAATPAEHAQAAELLQRAVDHNDALLSDLVVGSSQKGRDLNLLKRLANRSLDADVWRVQAKRMLGDRPLTAEIDAMIRKLAQEASDACG